jgi:hypothetical protein
MFVKLKCSNGLIEVKLVSTGNDWNLKANLAVTKPSPDNPNQSCVSNCTTTHNKHEDHPAQTASDVSCDNSIDSFALPLHSKYTCIAK